MIALKLAFRNLLGAGLRTWLTVFVLSLSYVLIIWFQGLLEGWNRMARRDMIDWEIGGGVYWQERYDPYDPLSFSDSHEPIPAALRESVATGNATPILLLPATIYPHGRMQNIVIKGIDPAQSFLKIPTAALAQSNLGIPAVIGSRMAGNNQLNVGDELLVRWRDTRGVFDATTVRIAEIFKSNVSTIDMAQIWLPLEQVQMMAQMPEEATLIVFKPRDQSIVDIPNWNFKNLDFLLQDFEQIIKSKTVGGSVMYFLLLSLALLAIFDTQVLAIFRRQREIGMHMALGMTRGQVVRLFTLEGAMYGILAALLAAIYGIPFLSIQAIQGYAVPSGSEGYGITIAEKIFPIYSVGLVLGTVILVMIATTIVSFLPAIKITKMKPTDAIRGKIQ